METKNPKALVMKNGSQKKCQKRKINGKNDNFVNLVTKSQSKKSLRVLAGDGKEWSLQEEMQSEFKRK